MFGKKTGLVLAGIAAYAYYKYNKMTPEQKRQATAGFKEKGQRLYDEYVPAEVKNMFGTKNQAGSTSEKTGSGSEYAI